MAEQGDQPARRPQRQEQQPQQRGLAGAGRAGEELERMRLDAEREVAQDLRPQPVAQADIFESDHPALSDKIPLTPVESLPGYGVLGHIQEAIPWPAHPSRTAVFTGL